MAGLTALSKGLTSLLSKKKGDVFLMSIDSRTETVEGDGLAFQFFPETITDSKAVNYAQKTPLGSSLPIYQWSNSGARTIGFTAVFATDADLTDAASALVMEQKLRASGQSRYNVDIRAAITWLRSFMMPTYGSNGAVGVPLTYAPNKVLLSIPNSGIGLAGGMDMENADRIVAVMTSCEVTYEAFFPSNLPRLATVNLSFDQVAQYGGMVTFPESRYTDDSLRGIGILPYTIGPRGKK